MKKILTLINGIRNYINNNNFLAKHFKNDQDKWYYLCVTLDILEDTCQALSFYETTGIGEKENEKYLKLYGLFQAVFLQQDSLINLNQILLKTKPEIKSNSNWKKIREIRNLTTGHPTNYIRKHNIRRCFISRITITKDKFEIIIWNNNKKKIEFKEINLKKLYNSYKSEALKYLQKIYNYLLQNKKNFLFTPHQLLPAKPDTHRLFDSPV